MKKIILAMAVLAALCSCSKDKPTKDDTPKFTLSESFESDIASYVWEGTNQFYVIDLKKGLIHFDSKEGGRTAILTYVIDEVVEGDMTTQFKSHSLPQSDTYYYEINVSRHNETEEGFQLRLERNAYLQDNPYPDQSFVILNRAMPLSEYKPGKSPTQDFYVEIDGNRYYIAYACDLYDEPSKDKLALCGTYEYVYAKLGKPEDFAGLDLKGKYACIDRGEITFNDKCKNASDAGAIGVVFLGNSEEAVTPSCPDFPDYPFFYVKKSVGEKFKFANKNLFKYAYDLL